ncbi:MAG: acyltransferase [Methylococcaceae bacterium]
MINVVPKTFKYFKHIDGLRAMAVLSVVFYHFGFTTLLSGGYVGVDVFFVISGYLITRIIISEIEKTGTFIYLNFYKRRVLRLFPALLFTLF